MKLLPMVIVLMLTACASCPPLPGEPQGSGQVRELLDYFARWVVQPVEEQRRAYLAAEDEFKRSGDDMPRLRLVMMLNLPRVPWHDDVRLLTLLAPYDGLPDVFANQPLPQFGLLLHGQVLERVRQQRAEQRRLELAVREEQRRMEGVVREEQRRAEESRQKLDALRAIDRELRPRRPNP